MSNKSPQVHCFSLIILSIQQTISTLWAFAIWSAELCLKWSPEERVHASFSCTESYLPAPSWSCSHETKQKHSSPVSSLIRLGTKTLAAFYKLYKQLLHVFYKSVFLLKTWRSKHLFLAANNSWQPLLSAKRVCIWGLYCWDHSLQSSSGWVDTAGLMCHTAGSVASKGWGWWFLSFTCWGSAFWNNLWESVAAFQKQAFREHKCELERA